MKKLLKRIFPVALLKRCFLLYNTLKINTIDKILYRSYVLEQDEQIYTRRANPFDYIEVHKDHMLLEVAKRFDFWKDWDQDEYLTLIKKPITIEPKYGWGIYQSNQLVYSSLGFSKVSYLPKPNLLRYWFSKKERFENVISLRDTGELNYFHFYNDVVSKLFYLEDHKLLDHDTPIVVAKDLFDREYFQYFIGLLGYEHLNWVVQDQQYISADRTIFCKPFTHTKRYYDRFRNAILSSEVFDSEQSHKIFLTRNPKRLRYVENMPEIEKVCQRYGFEIVDSEEYSIKEQTKLFAHTTCLVGIHGAGLMNLLFCSSSTAVLSIFAPGPYLQFHYILLANMYEMYFDAIVGSKTKGITNGGFRISPTLLEERIIRLIQATNETSVLNRHS